MTEEEIDDFFNYRIDVFIYAYVYSKHIKEILEANRQYECKENIFYNDFFLERLGLFIKDNNMYEYINDLGRRNIQDILWFLREYYLKNDVTKIEDINECIRELNTTHDSLGFRDFVNDELRKRVVNKKQYDRDPNELNYEKFADMYVNDIRTMDIICSPREKFVNDADNLILNSYFLLTTQKFIEDTPYIFKDDGWYSRTCAIMQENRNQFFRKPKGFLTIGNFFVDNEKTLHKVKTIRRKQLKFEKKYNKNATEL